MDNTVKKLLKGKWRYNIENNNLVCKNKQETCLIFENKNNMLFGEVLSTLEKRGTPDPHLKMDYEGPLTKISLEDLHRALHSCEILYEQVAELKQGHDGLYCSSSHITRFELNHHDYSVPLIVHVDPQQLCKVTRKLRKREWINTSIKLEEKRVIVRCEFPWTVLTIIVPTVWVG